MRQDAIGIVLAGGTSKRMMLTGEEALRGKAWCLCRGRRLLDRVCDAVRGEVGRVFVVAGPSQHLPPLPADVRVVRDATPEGGPLAGLRDGLRAAALEPSAGAPPRIAVVASCDVPLVRPEVVRFLAAAAAAPGCSWAVPLVHGHPQVLLSAMKTDVLAPIEDHLAAGRRDPRGLLERLEATTPAAIRIVTEQELVAVDPALDSFRDVDTPQDLDALERC